MQEKEWNWVKEGIEPSVDPAGDSRELWDASVAALQKAGATRPRIGPDSAWVVADKLLVYLEEIDENGAPSLIRIDWGDFSWDEGVALLWMSENGPTWLLDNGVGREGTSADARLWLAHFSRMVRNN